MKYILKKPLRLTESAPEVTELNFREEITAGDIRGVKLSALGDPSTDDLLKVAGRLCGQPDALMAKLSVADLMKVGEITFGFFATGLEIGTGP